MPQSEGILAYLVLHLLDELLLLCAFLVHVHHIRSDGLFHGGQILEVRHEVLILGLYPNISSSFFHMRASWLTIF